MIQSAPAGGHVVIASDKFKGSLTAVEVSDHISAGLRAVIPTLPVRTIPIADGGEGTLRAALSAGFLRVDVTADGPTGEPVQAAVAVKDRTAVVELAQASGLHLLPDGRPDALNASSYGAGQEGGLLRQLTKRVLEPAPEGGITGHIGYEKHGPAGKKPRGAAGGAPRVELVGDAR
ncbi:glycerate kinase [Streptomyces antimycoticus]|uniref:glycerate kinase n=1 Tax=Streptomyces antimycoticus TaxID=68175 RepID=UPI00382E1AA1